MAHTSDNKILLAKFLRFGNSQMRDGSNIWHSFQDIAGMLGLTISETKLILGEDLDLAS